MNKLCIFYPIKSRNHNPSWNIIITYWAKLFVGKSIFENCKVLSMIWNSSGGCGILPVSNLDQSGILLRDISKAPDETSCPSIILARKNIIMQAYSLFSRHQLHQEGCGLFNHAKMFTPLNMHMINIIFPKPCRQTKKTFISKINSSHSN